MNVNDVCIVVGHDALSKGAYSRILRTFEYDYNKKVAELVGCDVAVHKPYWNYRQKMKNTYSKLSHYSLTLELHFNAATGLAQGSEALYFHTNRKGRQYAEKYSELISREYGVRNRGAKPLSNVNQRGYWAVASGIPTGLILEPFFGDEKMSERFSDIAMHASILRAYIDRL